MSALFHQNMADKLNSMTEYVRKSLMTQFVVQSLLSLLLSLAVLCQRALLLSPLPSPTLVNRNTKTLFQNKIEP